MTRWGTSCCDCQCVCKWQLSEQHFDIFWMGKQESVPRLWKQRWWHMGKTANSCHNSSVLMRKKCYKEVENKVVIISVHARHARITVKRSQREDQASTKMWEENHWPVQKNQQKQSESRRNAVNISNSAGTIHEIQTSPLLQMKIGRHSKIVWQHTNQNVGFCICVDKFCGGFKENACTKQHGKVCCSAVVHRRATQDWQSVGQACNWWQTPILCDGSSKFSALDGCKLPFDFKSDCKKNQVQGLIQQSCIWMSQKHKDKSDKRTQARFPAWFVHGWPGNCAKRTPHGCHHSHQQLCTHNGSKCDQHGTWWNHHCLQVGELLHGTQSQSVERECHTIALMMQDNALKHGESGSFASQMCFLITVLHTGQDPFGQCLSLFLSRVPFWPSDLVFLFVRSMSW